MNALKRTSIIIVSFEELESVLPDCKIAPTTEAEDLGRLISALLRQEKETAYNVFLRKYLFFDSVPEIAERYDLKENTVKSMLFRTRNRLREYLRKEGVKV